MSVKIDLSKPLTEEEKEYLRQRGAAGEAKIATNARLVQESEVGSEGAGPSQEDEGPLSPEEKRDALNAAEEWIQNATVAQLREKAAAWELDTSGNKSDLQARLLEAVRADYATDE